MRILFIASDFPNPWEPGKAPFNLSLVRALRHSNHVRVVAPVSWLKRMRVGASTWRSESASIDVELDVLHPTYFYPPKVARWCYDWFYWASIRKVVSDLCRARRPDVVLAYWAHPDGAAAVRAARQCGAASAIIVGGSDVLLITRDRMRRAAVVAALCAADAVIAVNRHLRDAVVALGVPSSKVHVWSQGVDTAIFHADGRAASRGKLLIPPRSRVLLWVGRMAPVKGLDVLIKAMPEVKAHHPEARLYLVGDGAERRALATLTRQLKVRDIVKFVGAVRPHKLGDWYRSADVTVLPSRSEGLPNVLRESLACGTPFVASRVGGIAEIARDGIDRLVEPGKRRALADAICLALDAPAQPEPAAPRVATWDESAEALVATLAKLVAPTAFPLADCKSHRGRVIDDLADALVHPHL